MVFVAFVDQLVCAGNELKVVDVVELTQYSREHGGVGVGVGGEGNGGLGVWGNGKARIPLS